jgi:hypothetical protein
MSSCGLEKFTMLGSYNPLCTLGTTSSRLSACSLQKTLRTQRYTEEEKECTLASNFESLDKRGTRKQQESLVLRPRTHKFIIITKTEITGFATPEGATHGCSGQRLAVPIIVATP